MAGKHRRVVEVHHGVQGFRVGVAWLRGSRLVAGDKAQSILHKLGLRTTR